MSTIVEWVETAAQVEIVRAFNADAAQGFFFSRPMSSDDAVAFTAGTEVPQFSCTEVRTLIVSGPGLDSSMLSGGLPEVDSGEEDIGGTAIDQEDTVDSGGGDGPADDPEVDPATADAEDLVTADPSLDEMPVVDDSAALSEEAAGDTMPVDQPGDGPHDPPHSSTDAA
jgi:hypothetical protein